MSSRYLLIFVLITLLSCVDDNLKNQLAGERYVRLFFPTEQECLDAQPNPDFFFLNCFQDLEFLNESEGIIVFTDIVNKIEYSVKGDQITIKPVGNSEFTNELRFIYHNRDSLGDLAQQVYWTRVTGTTVWD